MIIAVILLNIQALNYTDVQTKLTGEKLRKVVDNRSDSYHCSVHDTTAYILSFKVQKTRAKATYLNIIMIKICAMGQTVWMFKHVRVYQLTRMSDAVMKPVINRYTFAMIYTFQRTLADG